MELKFKTGVNAVYLGVFSAFNIIILLLLTSKIFVTTNIGVWFGVLLLIVDLLFFVPMFFATGYTLTDDALIVRDWPFKRYKIEYEDIFAVEDGDFECKNKRTVGLSMNRIAIGYNEERDGEVKQYYIYISPAEMSLFLIKLSGRLNVSNAEVKRKTEELSASQAEHEKKKKQWQKRKEELKQENQPEIIKADKIDRFSGFTSEDKK